MPLPFHGESVKLVWKHGEEAICPKCQHRNACLQTMSIGHATIYECRDCHTLYITHADWPKKDLGELPPLNRKAMEQDAKVIGRSLGKQCYKCHSFDLEQVDLEFRKTFEDLFVSRGKGDKFEAARVCPTHRCRNCGENHRY